MIARNVAAPIVVETIEAQSKADEPTNTILPKPGWVLGAALDYHRLGLHLIRVQQNSKKPVDNAWQTPPPTPQTEAEVRALFKDWDGNIGAVTGSASCVIVVDWDTKKGKRGGASLGAWEAEHGALPVTRRHRTPSGAGHIILRTPKGRALSSSSRAMGQDIDVQAEGKQIVLPPSYFVAEKIGDVTGPYVLDDESTIADCPSSLLEALGDAGATLTAASVDWTPVEPNDETYAQRVSIQRDLFAKEKIWEEGGGVHRYVMLIQRLGPGLLLGAEVTWKNFEEVYEPRLREKCAGWLPDHEADLVNVFNRAYNRPMASGYRPGATWTRERFARGPSKATTDALVSNLEKQRDDDPNALDPKHVTFKRGDHTEIAEKIQAAFPEVIFTEGRWYDYDAQRGVWTAEDVERRIQAYVMSLAGRCNIVDEKRERPLHVNAGDVTGSLKLAAGQRTRIGFFDAAGVGLACRNGFVHVTDDGEIEILPHAPDHRARVFYDLDIDPNARAPRWAAFLADLFAGDADSAEKILCIIEFLGGALFGLSTQAQKCLVFYGSEAENGKSTLLTIASSVFPTGSTSALAPQAWGNPVRVAALGGKLLNFCAELPTDAISAGDVFKAVITGDAITANPKYLPEYEFRPIAGHVFAANKLPSVVDQSRGFWRRFIVITFNRCFAGAEADPFIAEKILAEERAGVLASLVQGAAQLQRRLKRSEGYTVPSSDFTAREAWRKESDSVATFLDEMTRPEGDEKKYARATFVYLAFKAWAEKYEHKPLSNTAFGTRMRALKVEKKKGADSMLYALRILSEPGETTPETLKLVAISGGR